MRPQPLQVHGAVPPQGQEGALPQPRQVAALPASLGPEGPKSLCGRCSGSFPGHEGGKRRVGAGSSLASTQLPCGLTAVLKTCRMGESFLLLTSPGQVEGNPVLGLASIAACCLHPTLALPGWWGGSLVLPLAPTGFASLAEPFRRLAGISVTEEISN